MGPSYLILLVVVCLSSLSLFHAASFSDASFDSILFNFTLNSNVDDFYEISDTARAAGMSKGTISIIESEEVRRAVFLGLLNPQPDSACFAGVEKSYNKTQDWSDYSSISIQARFQGQYSTFKVVLKDRSNALNSSLSFEQFFVANAKDSASPNGGFAVYTLPLDNFMCSYRGASCDSVMDLTAVSALGVQAAGGVYEEELSQQGVAALEIDWIALSS